MAITFGAVSASLGVDNVASSLTFSHTVGAGTDRALFVAVRIRDPDAIGHTQATAVTYAGNAMTLVADHQVFAAGIGEFLGAQWWRLTAPPVGTANVVVTFGNGVPFRGGASAISLNGVDQTTPVEANADTDGVGSPTTSASVTTVSANAWVLSNVYSGATSATLGGAATQREQTAYGSDFGATATQEVVTPSAVTHTWTNTASETGDFVGTAIAVKDAPGGGGSSPLRPYYF